MVYLSLKDLFATAPVNAEAKAEATGETKGQTNSGNSQAGSSPTKRVPSSPRRWIGGEVRSSRQLSIEFVEEHDGRMVCGQCVAERFFPPSPLHTP